MGTRSLTHIKDETGTTLVTIYRQYDGYPTGMGKDLKDILAPKTLGNGISGGATLENFANGMGCAAAAVIAALKDEVGNVYLYAPDSKDCWEEYVYTIRPLNYTFLLTVYSVYADRLLYEGPITEFDPEAAERDPDDEDDGE